MDYPLALPGLPGPPEVGRVAPALHGTLKPVGADSLPVLSGRAHLLIFWATWCGPCKVAVPGVMA